VVVGEVTPQVVQDLWGQFLTALRPRNLPLEALMRSCQPMDVEGDVIVLGFAHDFLRAKLEEEHNKHDVEDVLSELLGRRFRVRCVLAGQPRAHIIGASPAGTGAAAGALVPAPAPHEPVPRQPAPHEPASREPASREAAPLEGTLTAEQLMAQDPLVRAAVEDLGAQVRLSSDQAQLP
jgi:hypothetical protein